MIKEKLILKTKLKTMTFIIHHQDGTRETYTNRYDENDEHQRDAAYDDCYMRFPGCYIEEL